MPALIKAEIYKLFRDRSFFVLLALSILLGWFLMLDQGELSGYESVYAALYNAPILMLLTSVFGALYIGKDLADRTLYHWISAGHQRSHVFLSKAFLFIVGSNLILLSQPLLSTAVNSALHGWGHSSAWSDLIHVLVLFLTTAVLNAAMCGVSLLAAFLCKDIGKTLAIPAVFYFLNIFVLNGPKAEEIARYLPLGQLRLLLEQSSSTLAALLVGVIFLLGFFVAAGEIFKRSELY